MALVTSILYNKFIDEFGHPTPPCIVYNDPHEPAESLASVLQAKNKVKTFALTHGLPPPIFIEPSVVLNEVQALYGQLVDDTQLYVCRVVCGGLTAAGISPCKQFGHFIASFVLLQKLLLHYGLHYGL